jgi:ribosomal protein S18 acetylase RimI-like enzyme
METTLQIIPITEDYAERLRAAIDAVARERRYLASVKGFSLEETQDFIRTILSGGGVQIIALVEDEVVGWCDILRHRFEGFEHLGVLGMGVTAGYRGRGIGKQLLESSVVAAARIGIAKIELEVFSSNKTAIKLYEAAGFVIEGLKKNSRILDGQNDDIVCMAFFVKGDAHAD